MPMTFERSADTDAVIIALRGCNNEISYTDLARQAGLTVARTKAVLPSVRRALFSESGVLFGVIWGIGLRRLTDADKVKKPEAFKRRVVRGAGREIKHLGSIDYPNLQKSDQHSVTTNRTVLNVLRAQAKVKPELPKPSPIAPQPMANSEKLISRKN